MARKKKKAVVRRSGAAAAPYEKGIDALLAYFHTEVEKKARMDIFKSYVTKNYSKQDAKSVFACPDYKFWNFTHYVGTAYWLTMEYELSEKAVYWKNSLEGYINSLVAEGKELLDQKTSTEDKPVVSISPMERLQNKISNTIMQDLLDLEDQWMNGVDATLDIYSEFKRHGLPASATSQVRDLLEGWLLDYEDAYHKRCDDAVEGYAHLKRPTLKSRIKTITSMLSDLDRLKSAAKATRRVKVKGPRTADKQIAKVQYKREDKDYKLVSVPPIQVVGQVRLFTFNVKTRALCMYVTSDVNGFEISGSTIKNFDKVNSRKTKLRKPDDFIPIVLSKTPIQISKEWDTLSTKSSVPNGRLNSDTIILKVFKK